MKCTGSDPRWFSLVGQYWNKEGKEKEAHCGVSIFSRWTHPSFRIGGKSWGFYIFKVYSPQFLLPAGWKRIFLSHRTPPEYCAYCTPWNIVHIVLPWVLCINVHSLHIVLPLNIVHNSDRHLFEDHFIPENENWTREILKDTWKDPDPPSSPYRCVLIQHYKGENIFPS